MFSFKDSVQNRWLRYILILLCFEFVSLHKVEAAIMPDKVVFIYHKPLKYNQPDVIFSEIQNGLFTDTIYHGPPKVMTSTWMYIPGKLLKNHPDKNYVLTGYFDFTDLYQQKNGQWTKIAKGGNYLKFSEESEVAGRFYFKVFDDSLHIADAYLVACRRLNDYSSCLIQGELMDKTEIDNWEKDYRIALDRIDLYVLPFWGILLLTTLIMLARYVYSKDKAYLVYAFGNVFFIANYLMLYITSPGNIDLVPIDDPMVVISVTGQMFIMGVACFILSFRYFYTDDKFEALKVVRNLAALAAVLCLVVSIVNFFLNYYYQWQMIANIIMYVFLVGLMLVIYSILFYYRKMLLSYAQSSSFLTIIYGSLILSLAAVIGFILSAVYGQNTQYLGKYLLQSFPLLIGIGIYNVFVLLAFNRRDHQIADEANGLKIKAYEYEMKVLQNSLNPHFIFNSLNLIDFFVYRKDLPQARNALFKFSDLLRMVIDKTGEKQIPLSEELKMLDLYLKLECTRSREIFSFEINVSPEIDTDNILIPPLLIQPIAENAIKHGILNKEDEDGHIDINIRKEGGYLIFEVKDNGIGFAETSKLKSILKNDRKHLGMELTKRRLELFSPESIIEFKDAPNELGAIVSIKIPI